MSFSSEQKKYIIEQPCKSACCRRALLYGVMFAKAYVKDSYIEISIEKRESCLYLTKLVREFFGAQAQINRDSNGGRRYLITFESKSAVEYISNIENGGDLFTAKCDGCVGAFLRGVFLASGRASDPRSAYTIHFSLADRSDRFASYLQEIGLAPMLSGEGEKRVAYFASGSAVEDFYGTAGMNRALFGIMDERMEAVIRLETSRVRNCEMSNIKRAVDAAGRQYDLIVMLEKANLLSRLPDDLEATARLRLTHHDMSLSELSLISNPPISKPGLSHRLKKIMEIGEQLLNEAANNT